jgi:DNA polymerase-3 subunit delta'
MNSWNRIVGHDWAVDLLKGAIIHDRVGHAYLITGPRQIGKGTLAQTFAMALNCQAKALADRPCGLCRPCLLIADGRHPDVRMLLPEVSGRGKLSIKIDQIRGLAQELSLTATEARYKVAIIKQFDAANASAANAFLKTLEEPPNHVVLLLTASEADSLLPTISSRCHTIGLRPMSAAQIEEVLRTQHDLDPAPARLLAHLSNGRLGWAIQATQDQTLLDERETQLNLMKDILAASRIGRFSFAEKLARDPEMLPEILQSWLNCWRDIALLNWSGTSQNGRSQLTNIDQLSWLQQIARQYSGAEITNSLKQTEKSLWALERNANARLVLENLFLSYPLVPLAAALPD